MKKLLIISLFISSLAHSQVGVFGIIVGDTAAAVKDSAQFNFSLNSTTVAGFANLFGNPHLAVESATQNGITCSTRATTYWTNQSGTTAAQNAGQTSGTYGSEFPQTVVSNYAFSKQTACTSGNEQLQFSGLQPLEYYYIDVIGSRLSTAVSQTTRHMYYVARDNTGRTTSAIYDVKGNTQNIVTFSHLQADASGNIYLGFYGANDDAGAAYGYACGAKIKHE